MSPSLKNISFFIVVLSTLAACGGETVDHNNLVSNQNEFDEALQTVQPGDVIRLKNGVWSDFEILFEAKGTTDKPITLTAETKGKVILSGQSNLRLAGEHLIVSGLVFKGGYTPTNEVISFRKNGDNLAYNSRVTEVVIDNYNNPERFETDFWVLMYGKNNRFDHNHLVGKQNSGVTMAVKLDSEASQENRHTIDHNYFGPRPILGSNGGETLRIGTSHYSLTDSYTVVENNYFDRTNGELEIISNKSGKNIFRNNTFFEARGTLTMRHGNGTLVEGNVFFGNGKDHTGGIRVINADQTIRNNYMEGLKGYRFGGAFVIMNGVINSAINRYHQVKNAIVENNSIVNSDHIQLAAGSDDERQAVPVDSVFQNNMIFNDDANDIFTVFDDVSGIKFNGNVLGDKVPTKFEAGFTNNSLVMERAENGLLYAQGQTEGVNRDLAPTKKSDTGVSWYEKPDAKDRFDTGNIIEVVAGENSLFEAVESASDGDILILDDGFYDVTKFIVIDKPLTIKSKTPSGSIGAADTGVTIRYSRTALFEIMDGGSLKLEGLTITGENAPDSIGNSLIRTSRYSMLANYDLVVKNCHIKDLNKNNFFNFLTVSKSTMADTIDISDSVFENISGSVLKLDQESDDFGRYNAEYVNISGSVFSNIDGKIANMYRGGTDESTFGPHFLLKNSEIYSVGGGAREKQFGSVLLHGVQVSTINNNIFRSSQPINIRHTVGEPVTTVANNKFISTAKPEVVELNSTKTSTAMIMNNIVEEDK